MWETQIWSLVGKIPWGKKWQSTPVFLPGKSHGQRTLVIYSLWGRKELDTTEWLHFHNSLVVPLFQFGTSWLFHVRFWCCFLTCIHISQETGKVVWYSHLFKNFLWFVMIQIANGFSTVNEEELGVFQEHLCSLHDSMNIGNLISGSSASLKSSLYIWKFPVHSGEYRCQAVVPEPESSQMQTSCPVVCWNKSEENDPQKTGNVSPNKTLFRHWLLSGSIHWFFS